MKEILYGDIDSVLLLGDIGVFGFREELKNLSNRAYNIGILEQATVSVAAGLSRGGLIPFVHTIAPFMVERALEQIKIDFGYQELNGNFISVGASYDYAGLGCTHHCPGDIQALLTIPNISIIIPGTSSEFNSLLYQSYKQQNPKYYRLSEYENNVNYEVVYGKSVLAKQGSMATLVCYGPMLNSVMEAVKDMDVSVLYYTTIFPFDEDALRENYNEKIIVCEPFYEGTTNFLITKATKGLKCSIYNIGVPRMFLHNYGDKKQHDKHLMLDEDGIRKRIEECLI
jgi:transketolase